MTLLDSMDWAPERFAPPAPRFGERPAGFGLQIRPGAYAILPRAQASSWPRGSELLAVSDTGSGLYLPGGGREGAETAGQTLLREILEECALEARIVRFLGAATQVLTSMERQSCLEKPGLFFVASVLAPVPGRRGEHETLWLPPEELITSLAHRSHAWAVERWLAGA